MTKTKMTTLRHYNGDYSSHFKLDLYAELAKEICSSRHDAKVAFWVLVMGGSDLRLGAAVQGVDFSNSTADQDDAMAITGAWARPAVTHYVLQQFRILENEGRINYSDPVDNEVA